MTASTARSTALFAIATMLSRITGLARDSLFANYFGTSAQYDAYLVAIMIPFFLRKIFAD
ncbi:MAG: murein biosynthesis integral membrane protein MurJ, partial [Thermotogaceae bacterium]|nr:murein biosynthesis integral membrane protein MurJ [Thermotogaceae bacterium]